MLEVKGKFNTAQVFTDNVEDAAYKQILNLMNQKFAEGSKFAIMPDCHHPDEHERRLPHRSRKGQSGMELLRTARSRSPHVAFGGERIP